jgi:hypothetical protein
VPECPVGAIYRETDVPSEWTSFIPLNTERVKLLKETQGGHITDKQKGMEGPGCKK